MDKEVRFLETPNSKNHIYNIHNNFIAFYFTFIWRNQAARVLMEDDDFYNEFIKAQLDHYVSSRFEKIAEQYLIRNYKKRYQSR